MLYVIRFFPEITIKSKPVRHRLIRALRRNLRVILKRLDSEVSVIGDWDILEVETPPNDGMLERQVLEVLRNTPGISVIRPVEKMPLPDLDGMAAEVLVHYREALAGRTFAVRCKRQGQHEYSSGDIERHIGAVLMQNTGASGVDLVNPQITVRVEVRHHTLYVVKEQVPGIGGFPIGSQEPVLSLISGGFDSAVASYLCMRRGLQTHFIFFNLGGREHEIAVKEVALYLWMKFGSSHRVKFISVPFEPVVNEIMERVDSGHMGVVLKRMMMRAADSIARSMRVRTLVTGEAIAQVASQTLPNLSIIDQATDLLILRPLIVTDKQQIIDIARQIGTEEFSANVPEYCGVISVRPTTHARRVRIEHEEREMDAQVLQAAIDDAEVQMIDRVVEVLNQRDVEPPEWQKLPEGALVIDIRHPDEQERLPLSLPERQVLNIPFFRLGTQFSELDQQQQYALYCDRGMMSRLHASHLKDAGYDNVGVFRP
ncbi:tRNA uracil 4-sulfurtransferase ThiI [Pseudohongiella spirulinae]|uniref:tRNA sulfurtransferase n=1 Tax=Pseudohongiella spirulinae TaxID=1249552 RepID=A0A0S2K9Z9_9GAMM|nr:tRNA uracil 4-sulfurtransferase ThiI [Pseudohongiella spirulinae]ALO45181.1 tRNA s(4)U8 sulfurtransferase [Pseudohongiella spirulinae]